MTTFGYLRGKATRTLQLLQHCPGFARKTVGIFVRNESSFVPKKVLIVAKISRYHFEKLREPQLTDAQLKVKLLERGSDYEAMINSHQASKAVENRVIDVLKTLDIEYRVVDRRNLDQSHFAWADLILPLGGDGTFLLAANMVYDSEKRILGINSFPEKSEGFLMLSAKYTTRIAEIFEMLKAGHYNIVMRRRIRTIMKGEDIWKPPFHMHEKGRLLGHRRHGSTHVYTEKEVKDSHTNLPKERRLPWLALNEVFMGETLSARTSSLLLKTSDASEFQPIKCSGVCVSTGTGSTSWYSSINSVSPQTVKKILTLLNCNRTFTENDIANICTSFNHSLRLPAEEQKLLYVIRDMIVTNVWPLPVGLQPRGACDAFTVRSQCFDAGLVIDGGIAMPFNMGTTAELQMHPEDSLRCIVLPD